MSRIPASAAANAYALRARPRGQADVLGMDADKDPIRAFAAREDVKFIPLLVRSPLVPERIPSTL
jgi:hypothetical protein